MKPYGRRFAARVSARDKELGIDDGEPVSPEPGSFGSNTMTAPFQQGNIGQDVLHLTGSSSAFTGMGTPGYGQASNAFVAPRQHRFSNPPPTQLGQFQGGNQNGQHFAPYGHGNQQHGMNYY